MKSTQHKKYNVGVIIEMLRERIMTKCFDNILKGGLYIDIQKKTQK